MHEGDKSRESAAGAVFAVGVLSLCVGLLVMLLEIDFLKSQGIGIWSIVAGALFLYLGYKTKAGSAAALWTAITIYSLESLFALFTMIHQKAPAASGGLVVRGYLLYIMIRGVLPVESREAAAPARPGNSPPAPLPSSRSTSNVPKLSGETEKRRMQLSSLGQKQVPNPSTGPAEFRNFDIRVRDTASMAANALRYVAFRCEIGNGGIRAIYSNGKTTEHEWQNMASLFIRQLPPDKPWEGKLLLDILPISPPGVNVVPLRIFAATYVNYAALPGGQAANTAENIRRLAAHILQRNPAVLTEPGTQAFINKQSPPARFQHMSYFAEYDSRFK